LRDFDSKIRESNRETTARLDVHDRDPGFGRASKQQVNLSIVQPVDPAIYKGLEFRFDILNLFDQIYQIRNGSGVGVGNPQFGPRRTFLAGVTQRF